MDKVKEILRWVLEYVAQNSKLPFKPILMTDEDVGLIAIARERLKNPQAVKISLNDL